MRERRTRSAILLFVLAIALSGCGRGEISREAEQEESALVTEGTDSTDLERTFGTIDRRHRQLMATYREQQPQMDADLQTLYQQMEVMHDTTMAMGHRMMGRMMGGDHMMGRGRMMRRGGGMMRGDGGRGREWNRQMAAMHARMASYMRERNHDEMAALHDQLATDYDQARNELPEGEEGDERGAERERLDGETLYVQYCAGCHGRNGQGIAGAFPPLAGSEWVTGEADVPIRIVLHGLQGRIEVDGRLFDGLMPPFGARLNDTEIASVLSYIRSSWGNDALEVGPSDVEGVRAEHRGRSRPWSSDALR